MKNRISFFLNCGENLDSYRHLLLSGLNQIRQSGVSSIVGGFRPGFLRGREDAGGGAHILRGRTLIRISCPDWSNSVRTPRDVRYSCALIGQTAYVHPVTYAIAVL